MHTGSKSAPIYIIQVRHTYLSLNSMQSKPSQKTYIHPLRPQWLTVAEPYSPPTVLMQNSI
jgi:hypothetical protein